MTVIYIESIYTQLGSTALLILN